MSDRLQFEFAAVNQQAEKFQALSFPLRLSFTLATASIGERLVLRIWQTVYFH
jgi:hypothetical protein